MSADDQDEQRWRDQLSAHDYQICRQKGTEPAFTGQYCDSKAAGSYNCKCCGEPLFDSTSKFDSGSGWPSFFQPVSQEVVEELSDRSHGMVRTEIMCKGCGCHLGHVFDDGPQPTGLRYCVNSASLTLDEK